MRTIETEQKETEQMETEQIALAEKRQDFYGIHKIPVKGRVANFTPNTGLTKGVRSGRMKTFYQEGRGPKAKMTDESKVGDVVSFVFKGKLTVGLVEKFNTETFTVSIMNLDRKKVIRYNMYRELLG